MESDIERNKVLIIHLNAPDPLMRSVSQFLQVIKNQKIQVRNKKEINPTIGPLHKAIMHLKSEFLLNKNVHEVDIC